MLCEVCEASDTGSYAAHYIANHSCVYNYESYIHLHNMLQFAHKHILKNGFSYPY